VHIPDAVMLVANDIGNDTRVSQQAVALGKGGRRVTQLGLTASGRLTVDTIEGT
jgi:hypothetical protein